MSKFFRLHLQSVFGNETFRNHAGWVGLLMLNLIIVVSLRNQIISPRISSWLPQLLLNLYLLVVYVYGQLKIKTVERFDFMQLVWKMLFFGILATSISLFIEASIFLLVPAPYVMPQILSNFFYLVSMAVISTYMVILLVAYKRLILYEKSKVLLIVWRFFEYSLIASMILGVFNIEVQSFLYTVPLVGLIVIGIILSVNLKWVGYLDFAQKWKSMLMLAGITGILAFFSFFIYVYRQDKSIYLNLIDNFFVISLLVFCLFYTLLSCVVIFFNLPTSSVYERKLQEIKGFQSLNRKIQSDVSKEKLLETLLEYSLSSIDADVGWVEAINEGEEMLIITNKVDEEEINSIIEVNKRTRLQKVFAVDFSNPEGEEYFVGGLNHPLYKAILVVPLSLKEKHAGLLVLLKDIEGGFNQDAIEVVKTYADHTCVSIENIQLLNEAFQNERYKEELAIARRVQRSLLPEKLEHNEWFDLAVYSESTDEVGGDYYDSYQLSEHQYILMIGDVAGHGTTAAFTMSQLKAVFHSLAPLGYTLKEFVVRINEALSKCLGKATFVTLTTLFIDTKKRELKIVRAGHCPSMYFSNKKNDFINVDHKGMGIGIIRSNDFAHHLEETNVYFEPQDVMVLFTDGVIECKNSKKEEFEVERLKENVRECAHMNVREIQQNIVEDVQKFSGNTKVIDDLTLMIIKFN